MPLYDVQCMQGHHRTVYYHRAQDKRCRTHICPTCGNTEGFVLSAAPQRPLYFSEKHPVTIENLGPTPVTITSTKQHERIMAERGLAWVPAKRGLPGCWS